jgi:hypothetical protein
LIPLKKKRLWIIKIHSLFKFNLLKEAEIKKAMGSREAAHGPYFQFT